jgi:UV DNA damage endonuclease
LAARVALHTTSVSGSTNTSAAPGWLSPSCRDGDLNSHQAFKYLALENDERVWTVPEVVETARALNIPAITDTLHHALNPGGLTLAEAFDLSLPTWENREARSKLHLSSQDPKKQAGAHAYSVDLADWRALGDALGDREADVMVEAKGKEHALIPMGIKF